VVYCEPPPTRMPGAGWLVAWFSRTVLVGQLAPDIAPGGRGGLIKKINRDFGQSFGVALLLSNLWQIGGERTLLLFHHSPACHRRTPPYTAYIGLLVGLDLALNSKVDAAVVVPPWVRAPHSGARLAHGMEGILHRVRLDGIVQGGESPIAIPLSKDLDNWDGSSQVCKYGSILCSNQNCSQRPQWLSMALARLLVTHDRMRVSTTPRSAQSAFTLKVGKDTRVESGGTKN
jgi:hypothetical protein